MTRSHEREDSGGRAPFDADDESARRLLDFARFDEPPAGLEGRVLDGLWARRRLVATEPPRSSGQAKLIGAAWGFGLAAALAGLTVTAWSTLRGSAGEGAPRLSAEPSVADTPAPEPSSRGRWNPCADRRRADGRAPLIDDFEDGDDAALALEGRQGFWRWTRDTDAAGTAPALLPIPRPDRQGKNRYALRVKGGKLGDWGAAVELTFKPSCYDAAAYSGIAFSARGPGRIYLAPRQVTVVPGAFGGTCQDDCYNAHVRKIDLDSSFRTYEVRWTEVEQRGYGRPPLDPAELHSLMFQIHPEDTPYDIWIDDVKFLVTRT